jgi:nitrogen fixation protein NifU and related proteins
MPVSEPEEKSKRSSSRTTPRIWLGPFNEGIMDQPDGVGEITGPCGDTMEIALRIKGNRVRDSRFRSKGCAVSRACASRAAALAKGKALEEAWDINEEDIARDLPELPVDHRHCALLARDTLRKAIEAYIKSKNRQPL